MPEYGSGSMKPESARQRQRFFGKKSSAVTTRGFQEAECATLTDWMCDVLDDIENDNMVASVQQKVKELCARFPVYRAA